MINLEPFKALLLDNCGFTFSNGREETLSSSIAKRVAICKASTLSNYYKLLISDSDELAKLIELLAINETYFFREPEQLRLMTNRLIPEIIDAKSLSVGKFTPSVKIKIVSAGCSTGEEPYSIAIALHEKYGLESQNLFSVVGVDIDGAAIESAVKGVYGRYSFRGMDSSIINRYFEPVRDSTCLFQIKDFIKNQIFFQTANLNAENYPASMFSPDIIFYRNVSIYFPDKVQTSIFSRLANILNFGGYLIVSSTETIHHNTGILPLVEIDDLFVYKKSILKSSSRGFAISSKLSKPIYKPSLKRATNLNQTTPKIELLSASNQIAPKELFDIALEHTHKNRQKEAILILKTLIEKEPQFIDAHLLLANILTDYQNFKEAESHCNRALNYNQFCTPAYLMLGIIAHQTGRNDEGLKRLREALYIDANCWVAHFYLAESVNLLGDKKRAISAYHSALDILQNGADSKNKSSIFPLRFNSEQFKALCQYKLNILQKGSVN
ncbi:MAG: hypothetical protein HQK68_13385 [Desulfamplus sp.]|nr:hypothetical protein [Desulfamplus sp.]